MAAREEIGGSMEFDGYDYMIVPTIEAVPVNDFLLVRHLIPKEGGR
uniref:Tetrahydromethanopterin S-methyltransferase n=1 Tax=Ascaris lumbricoides TaxID=6252 RepID=A0A0M3I122_ASCLU